MRFYVGIVCAGDLIHFYMSSGVFDYQRAVDKLYADAQDRKRVAGFYLCYAYSLSVQICAVSRVLILSSYFAGLAFQHQVTACNERKR